MSRFRLLSLLTVIAVASTSVVAQQAKSAPTSPLIEAADRARIVGSPSAPIWLLIVSDFQCPFCRQWHKATWEAFRKEFVATGQVRVAYVNFPLGIHPNAKPAARAAMCAAAQGKFWEFADRLFDSQDQWKDLTDPSAFYAGIAAKLKLDAAANTACLADPGIPALIEGDYARMARAGTGSTPTFFIGGTKLEGVQPIEQFRKAIAYERARTKKP